MKKLTFLLLSSVLSACATGHRYSYSQLAINPNDLNNDQKLKLYQLMLQQDINTNESLKTLNQANENFQHFIESDVSKW